MCVLPCELKFCIVADLFAVPDRHLANLMEASDMLVPLGISLASEELEVDCLI